MSDTKFSPGPWQPVLSFRDIYIEDINRRSVAMLMIADDIDRDANAAIIAAAPIMYRALDLIRSMATANIPPSERLAGIAKWAEGALKTAQPVEDIQE